MLSEITDRRERKGISNTINRLKKDPELQGKPLIGPLMGYRSIRANGRRHRIVYKVDGMQVIVMIVAVGLRKEGGKKDVYARIQKMLGLK